MRVIIFCCAIAAPVGRVGCDRPQNVKSATPQQNSLPKTTTNRAQLKAPAGEVHDGITVADPFLWGKH